ncbi:uncharacterized protein KRP23_12613 [Phytophthora ramorum]|uniref:uncharacterized protein n=1 Tax=Phytophthora ramorum TaxID=164328 RepID=UPI0030B7D07A|nr:hypothetical protein KRP23_12613 [Phytophthora ramorum]
MSKAFGSIKYVCCAAFSMMLQQVAHGAARQLPGRAQGLWRVCYGGRWEEGQETVKLGSAAEAHTTYEIGLGPTQAMDNLPLKATVAEIVANWTRCGAVNRNVMKKFDTEMTECFWRSALLLESN